MILSLLKVQELEEIKFCRPILFQNPQLFWPNPPSRWQIRSSFTTLKRDSFLMEPGSLQQFQPLPTTLLVIKYYHCIVKILKS